MRLSTNTLEILGQPASVLPEGGPSVLQFGTGAFLRGFTEFFLQRALEQNRLRGGVVVVGSTGSGRKDDLNEQDGLFTLMVRGRAGGHIVDESEVITVTRKGLAASGQWDEVLAVARTETLELIVSNTTEVGIVLDETDRIDLDPPTSFPGKLTAVLYERARTFNHDPKKGLIVLPCELIEDNGSTLKQIVLSLATSWELGDEFVAWVETAVTFANTLVDRIVPGTPDGEAKVEFDRRLGYEDALLTVAEPYRLWAIEGDESFGQRLPIRDVDPGIVVAADISPYRERKVRILNGTHTVMVPAAILAELETVVEVMDDEVFSEFVRRIAFEEIVPTLTSNESEAVAFAGDVLDRFANPFVRHELIAITFQHTKKLRVRVLPTLLEYHERFGTLPPAIMLGLASFALLCSPKYASYHDRMPTDDGRQRWIGHWTDRSASSRSDLRAVARAIAADGDTWGRSLVNLPGFVDVLTETMSALDTGGTRDVTGSLLRAVTN